MVRLEEKYEQAVQFRKRGFTYSEIAKIVGVSKSTVSNWVAKKAFSKKIRTENAVRAARDNVKRIGVVNKMRAAERMAHYAEALRSADTEYRHYKKDSAFIAGLMAYVCLGDTTNTGRIRLSSTHMIAHISFIQFSEAYLGIHKDQLHFWLLLYSDQNEKKLSSFWSKSLKLSRDRFNKSQVIAQTSSSRGLQHGTGNTIIGNTVLKKKLLRWIELYSQELHKRGHG
jgi:predicted transcriptional regulator